MKRRPVGILDACVLIPMPLADTLLRLAEPPAVFQARWSDDILREVTRTLEVRFGKPAGKALYRESAMRWAFAEALVHDYGALIADMQCHVKDRHVLAAAVACGADFLVTFNLKDFPAHCTAGMPVAVIGPSAFLKMLWRLDGETVAARLAEQAAAIGVSMEVLLDRLEKLVPGFVAIVRAAADGKGTS